MRFLLFSFIFIRIGAYGQNLILNPSFEQIKAGGVVVPCEFMYNSQRFAETIENWQTYKDMTPDILGSAENCDWMPNVQQGVYCSGIIYYLPAEDVGQPGGYREAIQGRLVRPLKPGQRYRFSVWVKQDPALMQEHLKKVYTRVTPVRPVLANNLGCCFTVLPLNHQYSLEYHIRSLNLKPQINFTEIIETKGEWVQLSASFVADQPFSAITIGNFFPDAKTNTNLTAKENQRLDSLNAKIPAPLDKYKRVAYLCLDDLSLTPETSPNTSNNNSSLENRLIRDRKISLDAALLFDSGKFDLRPPAYPSLDSLAQFLIKFPQRRLGISGHTDDVGAESDNQILSEQRAQAVYQYLLGKGIQTQQIEWKAFGETKPIADNSTETGRQQNRRVECILLR